MKTQTETPHRFYIEDYVRRMIEAPSAAYERVEEIRQSENKTLFRPVHMAEVVPYPPALKAARRRFLWRCILLNSGFSAAWFSLAVWGCMFMVQGSILSQPWALWWRLGLAVLLAVAHYFCAAAQSETSDYPLREKEAEFRRDCVRVIEELAKEFN
jgi:hypothetical protein